MWRGLVARFGEPHKKKFGIFNHFLKNNRIRVTGTDSLAKLSRLFLINLVRDVNIARFKKNSAPGFIIYCTDVF